MGYLLDAFIYLPFNLRFIVLLVSTIAIAYIGSTYDLFFEELKYRTYIVAPSGLLLAIDVIAGCVHKSNPQYANKREYKARPSLEIFVEIVMLILNAISITTTSSPKLFMVINPLRIWKMFYCYLETSNRVGQSSLVALLSKYFICSVIIVHSFSCMWYYIMITEEKHDKLSWKMLVSKSKIISDDIWQWYIVSVYFVTNTFTTIGFGDIVGVSDLEKAMSLCIMVLGYITVTGLFLAAFTTFLTLKYKYYSDYKQRRSLIHQAFEYDYFPSQKTTESIKIFYDRFWQEEEGILHAELIKKLPVSLQEMVLYDIYKDALNSCPLLDGLQTAVKRSLSQYMTKQVFLPGWKIIEKEAWLDTYLYIAYGVAQVLTDEDDESSVFSVGLGSSIGSSTLIMSRPSIVHVNSATYCITHQLKRCHLFEVLQHYQGTNRLVIGQFLKIMTTISKTIFLREAAKLESTSGLKSLKDNLDELMKGISRSKEIVWYSENDANFKIELEAKDLTAVCQQLLHMNYIPAVETEEIMKDDACIRTEFPWVLEPNSQFLKLWGYLVLSTALVASLLIPYFAAFHRDIPQQVGLVFTFINLVYILDLFFVCITAQEMPGGRVSKSKEILKLKVKGIYFIVDVIGSLPLDIFTLFIDFGTGRRMRPLLKLNQLIGMVKVHKFFTRLENGFEVNLLALKIIKYVLYFAVVSYWLGSIYYSMACFHNVCTEGSWFDDLSLRDRESMPVKVRHLYPFEISIYFGLLVITQTAFGDIAAHDVNEMIVLLVFCFVGTFFFCYLIADYSATLTLQGSYKQEFTQFMNIMSRILENNKMPNALKFRIFNFMYLQWQHRQGYTVLNEEDIMWDLPERLKYAMKTEHTHKELKSVPLLSAMGDEFLDKLSMLVEIYMIPPNEVLAYAGSVCNEFYIIEEGNCQMIDGKNQVVRVIEATEHFNLFEMINGLRCIYNIKTATHCRVVSVTKKQIDNTMRLLDITSMREQLKFMVSELQKEPDMKKLKIHKAVKVSEMTEEPVPSGYLFSAGHRAHPNIDYLEPFNHYGFLSGLRFVLMPITINPNGPFMWWWEVFRGLCAFISSMIFPILPYISIFYPNFFWVAFTLDLCALADLYLRLHICYYNDNGLLVLHPLSTALHYFKTGFIVDFIAWCPINYLVPPHPHSKRQGFYWINDPIDLVRCNRLLQMHRLISWFVYQEKQILRKTVVFITFSKYFLISIVFLNTLAAWLEILTVNFIYNPVTKEVDWSTLKQRHSWIYTYNPDFKLSSLESILNLHIIAYYWIASVALSIGPGDISAENGNEMFFVCWVVVLGFLFYNYVLVIISNAKASIDLNLTIYQERMQSLVGFMRSEDVSRDLQKMAIQHFERVWQRTRGVAINSFFTKFTNTLREDCLLQIYEQTFQQVPVFEGVRSAFFRELATLVSELYFIKEEAVVRQNDVISSVLIVHQGLVDVIDCVGSKLKELGPGSIFGVLMNNCPAVRCNVSFIANKNADILIIPVTQFFKVASKQAKIVTKLQNSIYDGVTFIASSTGRHKQSRHGSFNEEMTTLDTMMLEQRDSERDEDEESLLEDEREKKTFKYWMLKSSTIAHGPFLTVIEMILNLLSVVLCSYDLAFQSEKLFVPIYVLEVLFIVTMFLRFFKTYEDPITGEVVTDLNKIALRYLKDPSGFFLDCIINIPVGLILKYSMSHYAMTWVNVTHLFRLIKVFKFIEIRSDRLNVKVVYIKVLVILMTFTLLAHIFACFWNVVHCPRNECSSRECESDYLCALYYTVVTLTSTGYGDMGPHTRNEYFYVVLMIIGSQFIFAMFLGDITNAIQTYNYSFITYEFQLWMLKKYLQVNGVSTLVNNNVIDYCTRLWQGYHGEQIPVFFRQANLCLQQDLSNEIYGKHFINCFLFVGIHKDLLRQIICCCNQCVFHPGDVIAYEAQVDDTMYIIHKGFVKSKSTLTTRVYTLGSKDFFGVPQGLYHDTPHTRTYEAISVCVILSLCLNDWEYLLNFFPASKVELYDRAKRLEVLYEDVDDECLSVTSDVSSDIFWD